MWQKIKSVFSAIGSGITSAVRWLGGKVGVVTTTNPKNTDSKNSPKTTFQASVKTIIANLPAQEAEAKKPRQISSLPISKDIMQLEVFSQLDTRSLAAFAKSSLYARNLAQSELDQRGVKKLFEYIREGEIAKVKKMLNATPRLASMQWKAAKGESKVIANKAGQAISIEGKTAYEFAIGEEDTEIAAMLRACIVKTDNAEVANALYNKQRPNGWEAEEATRSAPILAQLEILTQAIRHAQPGDITWSDSPDYQLTVQEGSTVAEALTKFKLMLDATLKETVTTGRHFNPNILLRAFEIYGAHYEDYFGGAWNNPRAVLFWQQVIGYSQRFMPVNYVQAFCDGIANTTKKLQKGARQGRALKFAISHQGISIPVAFYPLAVSRFGVDFALYAGSHGDAKGCWRLACAACGRGFAKFLSVKNSKLTELTQQEAPRSFFGIKKKLTSIIFR